MKKKIVGIGLIVFGFALLALVIHSIGVNLPTEGPLKGNIRGYVPPYYGHGLLMIAGGVGGVLSFLLGGIVLSMSKLDK